MDKEQVIKILERAVKIACELRDLPDFVKQSISVNAACLKSEIDSLESELDQALECVGGLSERGDWVDLDITDSDNYDSVVAALERLGQVNERDQIKLIKVALGASDCFDSNIEGLNSMLDAIDKPWFVMHKDELESLVEAIDAAKTIVDNAKY